VISSAINAMPTIAQSSLRFQFSKLLVEPLSSLPMPGTPIVLLLDALDECGTLKITEFCENSGYRVYSAPLLSFGLSSPAGPNMISGPHSLIGRTFSRKN